EEQFNGRKVGLHQYLLRYFQGQSSNILKNVPLANVLVVYFASNSTTHSMPYLSRNMPKYVPHGLSAIGISAVPPVESPLKILSASSLLSVRIAILLLFSFSLTFPINSGTSLPINTFSVPMGNAMYMILFSSF